MKVLFILFLAGILSMVRLYGSLDLIGRGKKNSGALNFKVEHRHKYGDIAVSDLGLETG